MTVASIEVYSSRRPLRRVQFARSDQNPRQVRVLALLCRVSLGMALVFAKLPYGIRNMQPSGMVVACALQVATRTAS